MRTTTRTRLAALANGLLLAGLALLAPQAIALPLAAPVSFIQCVTNELGSHLAQTDTSACSVGAGGALSAFGHVTTAPFVNLSGQAAAFGFPVNAVGASVTAALDYEFQVTGGNPGDVVPLLIATNLDTLGRDGVHAWGFASINIGNVFGLGVGQAACTPGLNCGGGPSFHGLLAVQVKSGGPNATVHLGISVSAGSSLIDETASASADPFIFVDPSFAGAALYTVTVSPGVANVPVPEPAVAWLWAAGLAGLVLTRRCRRQMPRR